MSRVLVFRPHFDQATLYGNAWLAEIASIARGLGHEVMDLDTEQATQVNLFNALETFRPELLFLCSHGNPTQFSGQNAQIVFTACQNDERMSGTQAYFLSYLMGQQLAPSMDEKDALTVAAYTSEFVWMIDTDYADRPLEDPYAFPFMRAVIEPSGRLLEGASWQQFYNLSVSLFNRGISEWFNSDDPAAPNIVSSLEHNRDCLALFGETAISPARGVAAGLEVVVPVAVVGGLFYFLFV